MSVETNKKAKGAIRVTVVEDNKLMRLGLLSLLDQDPGISIVAEAEDAETGIQLIESKQPDVVLMDIILPSMNGIDATEYIKNKYPQMKVIVYSAHRGEEEVIASLGSGADGFCTKDYNPDQLAAIIKTVYQGDSWLDPAIAGIALEFLRRPTATSAPSNGVSSSKPNAEAKLTERELEVLKCIVEGKNNAQIAQQLSISVHTAKEHVGNILKKLAVHDRVQAAVLAVKKGMV